MSNVTSETSAKEGVAKKIGKLNPLIDHKYGADPYAIVYNEKVYIYLTNDIYEYDEFGKLIDNTYQDINKITVISSADMVNWTDHGEIPVAGTEGIASWAAHSWAPAVAHKNINGKDKFFLYFANDASSIGVLASDSPIGPWVDPIGKPIVDRSIPGVETVTWCFDPAVLVDDDGAAYMYFGGGLPSNSQEDVLHPKTCRVIKLSDDMTGVVGEAILIDAPAFFEDSGIHKYNGKYYYSYCSNFRGTHPEGYPPHGEIAYMVSDNPMGPFTYEGTFLKNPSHFFGVSSNNHHCVFLFDNQWYVTYHAQTVGKALNKVKGYRSPHINKLEYYEDGRIRQVEADMEGVCRPNVSINPYEGVDANTLAWSYGIATKPSTQKGSFVESINMQVTDIHNEDWIAVANVDFGAKGCKSFEVNIASVIGAEIEIRIDSLEGEVIGSLGVGSTGGADVWKLKSIPVSKVTGTHNVFFIFKGDSDKNLFEFDYWKFSEIE